MERLTYWCPDGKGGGEWRANVRGTEVKGEEIDRLAYYEDMEEQGRLVVLEKKEHQADVLQYYKNYRDRLEQYEQALKGGAN